MPYRIEEQVPTLEAEQVHRKELLATVQSAADEYGLEMEPFTAWQEDEQQERVQGVFFNLSTDSGPWCVGAIVRRNNGELRFWPRDGLRGPVRGSQVITLEEIGDSILKMVEQFTAV